MNSTAEPREGHETSLSERIETARELAAEFDRALPRRTFPPLSALTAADFPSLTFRRLEIAARVQYSAGLLLLKGPWTAYSADVHVRGLLEIMAHTGWISGRAQTSKPDTARCRALCFERGVAIGISEIETSVTVLAPGELSPVAADQAAEQRKRLDRFSAGEHCRCRAVRLVHVQASLKAVQQSQKLPKWFGGLYDWLSKEVHQQTLDRMMFEDADGLHFIQSRFSQRAWSLTFLATIYGHISAWVMEEEGSRQAGQAMISRVQRLVDDPWTDRARKGLVDEELGLPPLPQ